MLRWGKRLSSFSFGETKYLITYRSLIERHRQAVIAQYASTSIGGHFQDGGSSIGGHFQDGGHGGHDFSDAGHPLRHHIYPHWQSYDPRLPPNNRPVIVDVDMYLRELGPVNFGDDVKSNIPSQKSCVG